MTKRILEEQWIRSSLKNPGLAALLSFLLMGLGQIYNGQLDKGLLLLFMEIALLVAGAAFSMDTHYSRAFVEAFSSTGLDFLVGALTAAFLLLWIYSVKDAHRGALMTYLAIDPNFVPPSGKRLHLSAPAEQESPLQAMAPEPSLKLEQGPGEEAGGELVNNDHFAGELGGSALSPAEEERIFEAHSLADNRDFVVEYAYGKLAVAALVLVLIAGGIGIFLGLSTGFRAKDRQIRQGIKRTEASPEDVSAMKELGRLYMKYGDITGAEKVLRRALVLKPDDVEIHVNLGNALQARGETREAQAEFVKAAVLTSRAGRQGLGKLAGATDEAGQEPGKDAEVSESSLAMIQDWMAAIKHNPSNADAYYNLGLIYTQEGLLDEAEYSLRKAIELDSANLDACAKLAEVLEARGDSQGAAQSLERVYRERPEDVVVMRHLSRLYSALDDFGRSLELTERLLVKNPRDTDALRGLAELCDTTLQYEKGLGALDKLLELIPGDVQALRKRASLCLKLHDTKGFIASYQELARLLPEDQQILRKLGQILFEQGDTQGARQIYEKLARLDSNSVDIYLKLADIYRRTRDLDSETAALESGLKIDPTNPFFLKTLGDIYYRTGRNYDAVVVLEKLLARGTSDQSVLRRLARLYSRIGDEKNEVTALERLLGINPRDQEAAERLVAIHRRRREFVVIENFYQKMLELNPTDPEAHRNLAGHYENVGNIEKAAQVYASLAGILTGDQRRQVLEKLVALYERLGQTDSMEKILRELIEMDPLSTLHMRSLAKLLGRKGDLKEQGALLKKLLVVDPSDEGALRDLAAIRQTTGDKPGELECLERLAMICPGDGKVMLRAGVLSLQGGKIPQASSYLDRAVREGMAEEALPILVDALEKGGELGSLIKALREVCELRPNDQSFHRRLGQALLRSGDLKGAREVLEKAWNMGREDRETTNAYLKVCLENRDTARMIQVYQVMAAVNPLDMEVTASLATLYGQSGDTEQARELWRKVRLMDRTNRVANENLLTMALAREESAEALEILQDLLEADPENTELIILKANLSMESGFVDKGLSILEDLLRTRPDNLEAARALGDHFMKVKDYAKAIDMYERVARTLPAEIGVKLARALKGSGDAKGAIKALKRALEKGDESAEAMLLLAELLIETSRESEASGLLEKVLIKEPDNRDALLKMASLLYAQGKDADGLSFLRRVLTQDPGCLEAIVLGARMTGRLGKIKEQTGFLSRAVELSPETAEYNFLLGQVLWKTGDLRMGYHYLSNAARQEPTLEHLQESAKLALLMSDFKEALKAWEQCLSLEPMNGAALYGAGMAAVNLGDMVRARECFATLIKVEPENNLAHEAMGNIYYNERDFKKASSFYSQAITLKSREHGPYFKLGMALKELGKYSEAKKVFLNLAGLSNAPEGLRKQARLMAEKVAELARPPKPSGN